MEKELFCPNPCMTAGREAIGQPISILNVSHVTVIIRHNCRLYRIAVFIAIIAFSEWIMNVCQEAQVSLVFHATAVKSPLVLTQMAPCFNPSVLGLRSLGMPFLCGLSVPLQKTFFCAKSSYRSGEEKKLFMAKSFYTPCQISHCSMGYCQVLCRPLSLPR